ncbi:neuroblastoma breakpoint family member 11-like isoform X2 [Cebus imitator]|uniref:neuroblastoma breakpoint family member 11-like isoform X2 n=1 Tax=Cebus imitator TaxID=2715852 RepID=UPI00189C25B4|nr:neuroblastoma breakpoint family member 11-like isoform X2 [Cebus imitator]
MVASGRPSSRKNTEVNIPEGVEKSCSQQEENKPNVGANKNRLLMSQVAYFLNYQEKTYKNDQDEDEDVHVAEAEQIQESRAPRLIREVPKVDVKRVLEDSLEECVTTRSDSYGPSDSSQPHGDTNEITFKEDKVNSALVVKSPSSHVVVEDGLIILSEDRKDEEDRQYGDSQNKLLMSQAAHDLGCRLKTEENEKDEDEDVHVVEAEEIQESHAPREVQKIEVKKVPEDSLGECVVTHSNSYGTSDSSQPPRDTNEITFEEDSIESALVVES